MRAAREGSLRVVRALAALALVALAASPSSAARRPTPLPLRPPAWVNEVCPTPSADWNGDGTARAKDDAFVEIVNTTTSELDISGWRLLSGRRMLHVFPQGTVLAGGAAAVVFGGGDPARFAAFPGAQVVAVARRGLRLRGLGGRLSLADAHGVVVDRMTYSMDRGQLYVMDQMSWRRSYEPDPALGVFVQHPTDFRLDRPSPGTRADGTLFGEAPPAPPPEIAHVVVRTLVLDFDPVVESQGGKLTHEVYGWTDPHVLASGYAAKVAEASGGYVEHQIVDWVDADEYAAMTDGFRYTDDSFAAAWSTRTLHQPNALDYPAMLAEFGVAERVKSGDVDEVWLFGFPYAGCFESCMAGPGAYWVNGTPLPQVDSGRKFVVMGFNYERGVPEMLHDLGHRAESILTHVYGSWNRDGHPVHDWDRFTLYDKIAPGRAACGTVHYPPNGQSDYDYANTTPVASTCDDWAQNWPNLTGATTQVSSAAWAGQAYEFWWLSHLPRRPGVNDASGKMNDWWKYVVDFNRYAESR